MSLGRLTFEWLLDPWDEHWLCLAKRACSHCGHLETVASIGGIVDPDEDYMHDIEVAMRENYMRDIEADDAN